MYYSCNIVLVQEEIRFMKTTVPYSEDMSCFANSNQIIDKNQFHV